MKYIAIERNSGHLLGDGEVFDTEDQAINATLKAIEESNKNRVSSYSTYTVAIERRLLVDTRGDNHETEEAELYVRADYEFDIEFVIRKIKA